MFKIVTHNLIAIIGTLSLLPIAISIESEGTIREQMAEKCNAEQLAAIPEILKAIAELNVEGPILVVSNEIETAMVAIQESSEGHQGFYLIACGWDPLKVQMSPNFRPIQLTGDFNHEVHSVYYRRF